MTSNNKKPETLNIKNFMQSDEYEKAKSELSAELNKNSNLFNIGNRPNAGSNLIHNRIKLKRHKTDTEALKRAKSTYKKELKGEYVRTL